MRQIWSNINWIINILSGKFNFQVTPVKQVIRVFRVFPSGPSRHIAHHCVILLLWKTIFLLQIFPPFPFSVFLLLCKNVFFFLQICCSLLFFSFPFPFPNFGIGIIHSCSHPLKSFPLTPGYEKWWLDLLHETSHALRKKNQQPPLWKGWKRNNKLGRAAFAIFGCLKNILLWDYLEISYFMNWN